MAEPVSNVIGGSLCIITMLLIVLPELKHMESIIARACPRAFCLVFSQNNLQINDKNG